MATKKKIVKELEAQTKNTPRQYQRTYFVKGKEYADTTGGITNPLNRLKRSEKAKEKAAETKSPSAKNLLKKIVEIRNWYGLAFSKQHAYLIKKSVRDGSISPVTIISTLRKLGHDVTTIVTSKKP